MSGDSARSPFARRAFLALTIDVVSFLAAAVLAWLVVHPPFPVHVVVVAAVLGAALAVLALSGCDAYKPNVLGDSGATFRSVLMSMGLALAVAFGIYFAVQIPEGALPALVHTAAFFFPILLVGRAGFRLASGHFRRRVVILGTSDVGIAIARLLHELPNLGIELVGFLSDRDEDGEAIENVRILGEISETEKVVRDRRIDWILVASRDRDERVPADLLLAAKLRGLRVDSGLAFYERLAGCIYVPNLRWSYLIFADGLRERRITAAVKRALDVVGASVALVLSAPFLALAALAIRIDTPGPAIFRQPRVGRGGRLFDVVKLRSMQEGAEDDTGATFTCENDERITRVGRVLRRTHLDEVPQLWNVLKGEMSLVGPRPERPEFVETLTSSLPLFRFRSIVKPGVTGWAQVRYGYTGTLDGFEQKLAHDLYYLKHRSTALDIAILWETLKEVVLLRGT